MSFELVDSKSSQLLWVAVSETAEVFAGSLVQWDTDTAGVEVLGVASGAFDASNDSVIAGLVVGTSNEVKVFEDGTTVGGTFRGQEITGVVSQANLLARTQIGNAGMYRKGEKMALVQIAVLDATTRLRARVYNATYGTALTLLTVTTASTDGGVANTYITNASDLASVANFSTIFCRSGANAGLYRVLSSTSTTTHLNDVGFPFTIAIDDTFVMVPQRQGYSRIQVDAQSTFINGAAITAYYGAFIDKMDLRVAGEESIEFRFPANHFGPVTA